MVEEDVIERPRVGQLVPWLTEQTKRDAVREGLATKPAAIAFWIPIVGGLLTLVLIAHRAAYYWFLDEDHVAEWTQFGMVLAGSGIAVLATLLHIKRREYKMAVLLALVALALFVISGEEISWGQRVFNFGTPADLKGVNAQGEFNVHDITSGGLPIEDIFKFVEMAIALVGFLLSVLVRFQPRILTGKRWSAWSPPLFLAPAFLVAFLYRFFRFTLYSKDKPVIVHFQEWIELCLYFAFLSMTWLYYRNQRVSKAGELPGLSLMEEGNARPKPAPQVSRDVVILAVFVTLLTVAFVVATVYQGVPVLHPGES